MAKIVPILIIMALSMVAGYFLFHPGLIPTHDGEYHVVRFFEFSKAIKSGQFYPRWAPDLNSGYGVPLFTYNYPLPNYLAFIFNTLGFSFIDSFKIILLLSIFSGGIFTFLWTRKFWGTSGGLISSAFYIFSPYHFVDIFVRGSVGELLAMSFFPGFLWTITEVVEGKKKYIPLSIILLSLLIFSHNILAYMFFLFALFYVLFFIFKTKSKKVTIDVLLILSLSLGISAIFWMPALLERPYVKGLEVFDYSQYFPQLYQLIFPSWGTGFSGSFQNEMSYQIGVANLGIVFLSFFLFFFGLYKKNKKTVLSFFIWSFIITTFLITGYSKFVWEKIPLFNYFQFPWRLLSLTTLICAFLAGSVLDISYFNKNQKIKYVTSFVLISFVVILGVGYAKPAYYLNRTDSYYSTKSNFIDGTNSPGNAFNTKWFNPSLPKKKSKIELVGGSAEIIKQKVEPFYYRFTINSKKSSTYLVNTAYFPGWSIFIDNVDQKIYPNKDGLFTFRVTRGIHTVNIKIGETDVQKVAKLISLTGFITTCYLLLRRKIENK